jgi:hypothetical protein
MNAKQFTEAALLKKYKGRYIDTHATYDYTKREWLYEVRSVSLKIKENHNLPEEEIIKN